MNEVTMLRLDQLSGHPDNPRKELGDLTELANSIKEKGLYQPLTVVPYWSAIKNREIKGQYTIIIGHRRAAAAKQAGLTELPCIIMEMSPAEQLETMMIENMQRSDLSMTEEADGFQLMLNLGSTVETVAKKTGISETTVRRRLNLGKLDRKHLLQATERGGTLQDYEKLMKIKDPHLRDNVLRSVGTPGFQRQLQTALEQQETEVFLDQVEAQLVDCDWCRERGLEEVSRYNHPGWLIHQRFGLYDKGKPKDPGDGRECIWIREAMEICILSKTLPAETRADRRKAELREAVKGVERELEHFAKFYRQSRMEFMKRYRLRQQDIPDILEMMLGSLYKAASTTGYCADVKPNAKTVAEVLGLKTIFKIGDTLIPEEEWMTAVTLRPELTLLACWYGGLEYRGSQGCIGSEYDRELCLSIPVYRINPELDRIYSGLMDLGYEIGDEEFQLLDGTHPIYKKGRELVEQYRREEAAEHEE